MAKRAPLHLADDWKRWPVPAAYSMTLLEIAEARGLSLAELLTRARLGPELEGVIDGGLTLEQHVTLVRAAAEALDDPALGVEMGWRLPPTALGAVGRALLACDTARHAVTLLERFWHLVARAATIAVDARGEVASVEITLRVPGLPEARRVFLKEMCVVGMKRGTVALVPEAADEIEVWFDFPEPAHAADVRRRLGNVRYGAPACQFRVPTRHLDARLAMASPVALKAAIKDCEREERESGLAASGIVGRLQTELTLTDAGYPSVAQVARKLAMAPRTLRRHLAREGTSFTSLLDAARRRDALRLLDASGMGAAKVAERLGYVDPANFTRAFRRWTGDTPTQYQQRRRGREPAKRR
jgi:AraC-like DNA-binding protein